MDRPPPVLDLLWVPDLVEILAGDTHLDSMDAKLVTQALNEVQAAEQTEFFPLC